MGKIDLLVHSLVCQYNKSCFKTFKIFWFANLFNDAGLATIAMWEWGLRKCLLKINRLYQFIRNIQPYSFIGNIHPCSFLETFTPTRLLDTYSPLLVYYISRKIPAYSLIRAYSFIRELRVSLNVKIDQNTKCQMAFFGVTVNLIIQKLKCKHNSLSQFLWWEVKSERI